MLIGYTSSNQPPARFQATDCQPFECNSSASSQRTCSPSTYMVHNTSLQQDVMGDSAKSLAKAKINNIHLLSPHPLSQSSKCRWLSGCQTCFPLHKPVLAIPSHLPVHIGKQFWELSYCFHRDQQWNWLFCNLPSILLALLEDRKDICFFQSAGTLSVAITFKIIVKSFTSTAVSNFASQGCTP